MERLLTIDGLVYKIYLEDNGEVLFSVFSDDLDKFDYTSTGETTLLQHKQRNAYRILKKVAYEVIDMVYSKGLSFFRIMSHDEKRTKVYNKLIKKIIKQRHLPWNFFECKGLFYIYNNRES